MICGPGEGVSAARTSGGTTAGVLFAGRVKASALLGRMVICGPGEGVSAARTSGGTTAVVLFAGRVKALKPGEGFSERSMYICLPLLTFQTLEFW